MSTISARIPDDLEEVFQRYVEEEGLDRSTAVRRLLTGGLADWRKRQALERLESGELSFSKAAEFAELSVWDFARLAKEHDVVWVSGEHLEDDLGSV